MKDLSTACLICPCLAERTLYIIFVVGIMYCILFSRSFLWWSILNQYLEGRLDMEILLRQFLTCCSNSDIIITFYTSDKTMHFTAWFNSKKQKSVANKIDKSCQRQWFDGWWIYKNYCRLYSSVSRFDILFPFRKLHHLLIPYEHDSKIVFKSDSWPI